MVTEMKEPGRVPGTPGVAPGIEGAPATLPGGNDGKDKTKMSGAPAKGAAVPPPVSADLAGSGAWQERQMSTQGDKSAEGDGIIGLDRQIALLREAAARHAPESEEERRKRERRERSRRIIGAMSDGLSALGNLYFTSQYAPDMYDPVAGSQLKGADERIERLRAEREANADRYLHYALKIGDLENAKEQQAYQRGRDALADRIRESAEERAQAKADRDAAMQALKAQLMLGKISEQDAQAKAAEIEADYAERYWGARIGELKSRERKNDRWQPSSRSGGSGRGGGSGGGTWYAQDSSGNIHTLTAKSEAQAHSVAGGNGWQLIGAVKETSSVVGDTSSSTNAYGEKTTRKNQKHTMTSSRNKTQVAGGASKKSIGW